MHETLTEITVLFLCYNTFGSKKRSRQKLMTLLINQVLFSFEMRKYASFVEITMIRMAITKAQVVSFDS